MTGLNALASHNDVAPKQTNYVLRPLLQSAPPLTLVPPCLGAPQAMFPLTICHHVDGS